VEWRLLDGVAAEDARRVLSIARRRTFGRAEVVFHQHDPADSLHLIVEGRFAMQRPTPLGEETLLAIRGPGDVFGELALVSERNRSATAAALEPGETLCVHRHEFDELRRRHPSVDRMLVSLLAQQVQRMNELLSEAFYENAERRVLRRLLELGQVYGAGSAEPEIPLTQEKLASLAGTSRATVNAVLAAEQRRGTIALRRGVTVIRDAPALTRRAGLRPTR
jgi:CRP/FNR family cyclic AMP-dependent transcriptional regulator